MLRERHKCPYFRILVIGRANAGKTTILENVCGVAQGTQPIIYDEQGVKLGANIKPKPEPNLKHRFKLPIKWPLNRKPVSYVQTAQHLMPSMEVSCRVKYVDLYPLMSNQFWKLAEGCTWYWAPGYLSRQQFCLPWLWGFWSWWKQGDRDCLEIHWEAVYCNWSEESITCNLVSYTIDSVHSWITILFIGIVYQWTALVLYNLQNLSSSIKEQGKASQIIY